MAKDLMDKLKWLDPFTYVDLYVLPVVNPEKDKNIETAVYIVSAFIFAFILYNFVLAFILGTGTPLVIVFSGSMEPVLYRGDIVVLTGGSTVHTNEVNLDFPLAGKQVDEFAEVGSRQVQSDGVSDGFRNDSLRINGIEYEFDPKGDIVVYHSGLRNQDIIHRAVLKLNATDGSYLITFGDNNSRIDQDCLRSISQCIAPYPVPIDELNGKYLMHIPLLGYVKLFFFDDLPRLILG